MSPRVQKTTEELWNDLRDQVELLVLACESFDNGRHVTGKHMALNLRVLLHTSRTSHSLLAQLGLVAKLFLDTAGPLSERNIASESRLTFISVGDSVKSCYLPLCHVGGGPIPSSWVPFDKWWESKVVADMHRRTFTRKDLILHVANTDGGAHVDPMLDEQYRDLSHRNSLGWLITAGEVTSPLGAPTMACMRQITHEIL